MAGIDPDSFFVPLKIAVLTVSDSRTRATDRSGDTLEARATAAGHTVVARRLVPDEVDQIEAALRSFVEDDGVEVVLCTGGTGITARDVTPEAFMAVLDKTLPGFGELFRWLSYAKIGTATIHSRALAGTAQGTLLFALPGSPGACRDAWDGILATQLDSRYQPSSLVHLLPRLVTDRSGR